MCIICRHSVVDCNSCSDNFGSKVALIMIVLIVIVLLEVVVVVIVVVVIVVGSSSCSSSSCYNDVYGPLKWR